MEPQAPHTGATFENPFRRPCLFIVTDFKPFLEVPVMFLIVVKICEPKTQKCLRAPLETVGSHFHKSYVTNNASALFIRQPENQKLLTFWAASI